MKKAMKIVGMILAIVLVLSLTAGVAVTALTCVRMAKQIERDDKALREEISSLRADLAELKNSSGEWWYEDSPDDPAQEDDVVIAGEYVIRSTKPISQAYLTGDRSGLDSIQSETLDMAAAILDEIITDDMTDYEKELAVYDWMTANLATDEGMMTVIPETGNDPDNPYGVLKHHNAVCVGYATTFRLFMEMLEIPCMVVHNSACYHSWDLVQLDGGWYHTDIYSDVGVGNYAHFNLSDSQMYDDWNRDFYPAADSYEYNYAYQIAQQEDDIYAIPALLREALDNREPMAAYRIPGLAEDTERYAAMEQMMNQIQMRIGSAPAYDYLYLDWTWIVADDNEAVLAVNFYWPPEDDPGYEDVDLDWDQIDSAVEDAFGDVEINEYYYGWNDYNDGDDCGWYEYDGETGVWHEGPVG